MNSAKMTAIKKNPIAARKSGPKVNTKLIAGAVCLGLLMLIALSPLFSNLILPIFGLTIEPPISNLSAVNLAPSLNLPHILGTDALGHDLVKMIAYGALGSLSVGLCSALVAVTLGNIWGAAAALAGGAIDSLMMRLVDALLAVPSIILLLTLSSILSAPELVEHFPPFLLKALGVTNYTDGLLPYFIVILAITATTWLESARVARARVLAIKEEDFFLAAQALGSSFIELLSKHLLPALATTAVVEGTLLVSDAIIMESGLSFLGLGLGPSTPSWGSMLKDAQSCLTAGNWWAAVIPGLLICFTVLSVHMLGEGFFASKRARGKIPS